MPDLRTRLQVAVAVALAGHDKAAQKAAKLEPDVYFDEANTYLGTDIWEQTARGVVTASIKQHSSDTFAHVRLAESEGHAALTSGLPLSGGDRLSVIAALLAANAEIVSGLFSHRWGECPEHKHVVFFETPLYDVNLFRGHPLRARVRHHFGLFKECVPLLHRVAQRKLEPHDFASELRAIASRWPHKEHPVAERHPNVVAENGLETSLAVALRIGLRYTEQREYAALPPAQPQGEIRRSERVEIETRPTALQIPAAGVQRVADFCTAHEVKDARGRYHFSPLMQFGGWAWPDLDQGGAAPVFRTIVWGPRPQGRTDHHLQRNREAAAATLPILSALAAGRITRKKAGALLIEAARERDWRVE